MSFSVDKCFAAVRRSRQNGCLADRTVDQGISLPISQFSALVSLLPQIESVLREGGEDVPRPKYDEVKTADDRPVDEVSDRSHEGKKRNFEETSDEE